MEKGEKLKNLKDRAATALGVSSFIEISGNSEILLSGCTAINDYSAEEIKVSTLRGAVSICGKDLKLSVYRGDIMSIEGTVTLIRLGE